jgi:HEAT repeat protein
LRRAAAIALVRFGPDARTALPELRKALNSTDVELRLAAAEAVLAIERKPRPKEL